MTAPISRPDRSRIGAAESWIEISCSRRLISQRRLRKLDRAALAQAAQDRAVDRQPRRLVDHLEHFGHRATNCLGSAPTGQFLSDRVQVLDVTVGIGGEHCVADRLQRDLGLILFCGELQLHGLALADVGERSLVADDLAVGIAQRPARSRRR